MEPPTHETPEPRPEDIEAASEAEGELDLFGRPAPQGTWAHRKGEPRVFALLWTGCLLAMTGVALVASGMPWSFSEESLRSNTRWLLLAASIGALVLWPMLRLSQRRPAGGGVGAVLRDLVIVLAPMQAVIWPPAMPPNAWPASVSGALALWIAGWTVLVGGAVALALGPGRSGETHRTELPEGRPPSGRARLMASIIAVTTAGLAPALLNAREVAAAGEASGGARSSWMYSPYSGVFEIARARPWTGQAALVGPEHWRPIGVVWAGGAVVWAGALVWSSARRRRSA